MSSISERNASIFESELLNPLRGHDLSEEEAYVANLLLDASSEKPMDNDSIRRALEMKFDRSCDARTIKKIIRTLRKEHAFPILARRIKPFGYWWCSSKLEMQEFIETFRSQALDELHTLSRIVKENFPELAGQLRLEME